MKVLALRNPLTGSVMSHHSARNGNVITRHIPRRNLRTGLLISRGGRWCGGLGRQDPVFCRRGSRGRRRTLQPAGSRGRTRDGHAAITLKRLLEILLQLFHFIKGGLNGRRYHERAVAIESGAYVDVLRRHREQVLTRRG